ncbi:MAG: tetratricopeptide repeat protein [Armatimonadota bacterium]
MKQSGAVEALGTLENPDGRAPTLAEINLCKLRGQSSVAIALAQQRLESIPDCATTHALLGDLYENAGHMADARHHYALAVDCAPANQDHADRLRRVMRQRDDAKQPIDSSAPRNSARKRTSSKTNDNEANVSATIKRWFTSLPQSVKLGLLVTGAIAFTLGGIAVGTSLINRGPDPARAKQQPTYPKFNQMKQSSSSGDNTPETSPPLAEGAKTPILGASAETSSTPPPDDDPIDLPGTQNLSWDPERKRLTFDVQTDIPKLGVHDQRIQLRRLALRWLDNAFTAEPDAAEAVVNLVARSPKMTLVTIGATRSQSDMARNADIPADSTVSIEEWAMPFKS